MTSSLEVVSPARAGRPDRFAAFWRLARPVTLPAPAMGTTCAAAAGLAAGGTVDFVWAVNVVLAALSLTVLNAGSNALNQYTDRAGDALDRPNRPLPSGRLSVAAVLGFAAGAYLLAVTLAALVVVGGAGWGFAGSFALILVSTVAYSVPPIRAKRRWWAALPTIALARGLALFLAGWSVSSPLSATDPWVVGGVLALFLLGTAATKDWADRRGDAATGCRTLPLCYGTRGAARRVAPFFVAPWPLLFAASHWLRADPLALTVASLGLTAWGLAAARLLVVTARDSLPPGRNHQAWGHMYAMLAVAYLGVAVSYVAAR